MRFLYAGFATAPFFPSSPIKNQPLLGTELKKTENQRFLLSSCCNIGIVRTWLIPQTFTTFFRDVFDKLFEYMLSQ